MIQRVFYADLGPTTGSVPGWDLDGREHLALWPMVALFLALGVASPLWMRAIDTYGAPAAGAPSTFGVVDPHRDLHPPISGTAIANAQEVR
jgi:NADH-quinone oxidoreductase subunit M